MPSHLLLGQCRATRPHTDQVVRSFHDACRSRKEQITSYYVCYSALAAALDRMDGRVFRRRYVLMGDARRFFRLDNRGCLFLHSSVHIWRFAASSFTTVSTSNCAADERGRPC